MAALSLAILARSSPAPAQPRAPGESGIGSIACFVRAEATGLESQNALELCIGAASEAPALCFDEAVDRVGLSDVQAVPLCRATRSIDPALCAENLDDIGFEDTEIVGYCAAVGWPLIPAPTAGAPSCVQAGLDRTFLTEEELVRLCRGSISAAPIDCFEAGDDAILLDARDIVTLCSAVVIGSPTPYGITVPGLGY